MTITFQTSLSMGFSRQEYWDGLPCPSPGDLPNPEIEPTSLKSPELAGRFFTTSPTIARRTLPNALWWPEQWGSPKGTYEPYVYLWLIHFTIQQKLTQHCKATISSVQFSHSVMSDSLWPYGLCHARLPYPSPTLRACSNSCPSSWRCHPTISSSVVHFSCHQLVP